MIRYVIIAAALLGIMTMGGCQRSYTTGGPDTMASAKVSVQRGCLIDEWNTDTGGAVRLREWLNGFETEPAESVPEADHRRYEIELTFGRNAPESCIYLDFGDEYCLYRGGEWSSVKNPSPIPIGYVPDLGVDVWDIVKVEYAHNAEIKELELSDKEKMSLSKWLCGLKYERREFPEGETPGDSDGGEAYGITFANGELAYVDNGGSERFLLFNGEWYGVCESGEFPIET